MATDDPFGRHVIEAASELGLCVPDEVAVVGVNNDKWVTQLTVPALPSVEPDWKQLGYRAAHLLDRLMRGEPPPAPLWIPPLGVVGRSSTDTLVTKDPVVTRALAFARDHCGPSLSVGSRAAQVGVSRRSLEVRMKRAVGKTPHTAICTARLERANAALARSNATMAQIASDCGVAEHQFYALFKRVTGMTPGKYRQRFGLRHGL